MPTRHSLVLVGLLAVSAASAAPRASAQLYGGGSVLWQGIVDGELWSTNTASTLLTRNRGRPAGLARVQTWGAYQPFGGLVLYSQVELESGPAREESGSDVYADQYGARYIFSPAFTLDAGRFTPMIGTFSARQFSTRNPLIGEPDGYTVDYPYGVKLSGEFTHFDYRVALVDRPTTHENYEPNPTSRLRPAIGAGYTPFVGFRLGASFTRGSYLNRDTPAAALSGRVWSDYQQTVTAADLEYSRGYFDAHVEGARGSYQIPGRADIAGFTYYGEGRYALTPRLFVAARVERNDYPFIRTVPSTTTPGSSTWIAHLTDFVDGEIGGGYRLTSSTLLKLSWRADRWWVRPAATNGRAFATQISQSFDVMDWLDRVRQQ
jgi:hypothetical protein